MLLREWYVAMFGRLAELTTLMLPTSSCSCTVQVLVRYIQLTWKIRRRTDQRLLQKRNALGDEVSEMKVKRKTLQNDADALSTAADDFLEHRSN